MVSVAVSESGEWFAVVVASLLLLVVWLVSRSVLRFHGVIGNGVRKVLPSGRVVALPPGRMGWPLFGETIPFVKAIRGTSLRDFTLHRYKQYESKVFKTHVLGHPTVVISGPEANRLVLFGEYRLVDTMLFKSLGDVLGTYGLLNAIGDLHKFLRRLLVGPMGPDSMKGVLPRVEASTLTTLEEWVVKREFSAYQGCRKFTYSVILDVVMSVRSQEAVDRFFQNIERLIPGGHNVPLMIPGTPYYKGMKAREDMHAAIDKEIARRKALPESEQPVDVLANMLKNIDYDGTRFNSLQIKDSVLTMMFAGYDTTSSTLACLIQYIYRHPDVHRRLQEENDQLRAELGPAGSLTLEIIKSPKMRYTQMVIQEAHRLLSLAYAIGRSVKQDIEFEGYLIPKGWYVLLDVAATHYNPDIFEDPFTFNPSRFEKRSAPFTFIPFGMGPRMCAGQELASMELLIFLHHLVTKYNWVVTAEDQGMDFAPAVGRPRNKVPIRLEKRDAPATWVRTK